jgi:hypothetical protein
MFVGEKIWETIGCERQKSQTHKSSLMKSLSLVMGRPLAPKNLYYWELLYLPSKRPILHPSRGLDLLGTKVLQWCYSGDSVGG